MAVKIDKKELTEPDTLQLFFYRVRMFAKKNRNRIYAGTGLFLLIAVIAGGWYLYRLNYETSAGNTYARVLESAMKAGFPAGGAETIKGYKDLIARYPRSRAAITAYYRLGNLYFGRREVDAAIGAYQDFLDRAGDGSDLVTLAYNSLGSCYELKNDFNKALDSYEKAMKTKTALSFELLNYRNIARVYEAMNNAAKAAEYYRKALEKTTDPLMTLYLKRKISLLG
jgi:tetratricopeptide (TPR) repeat protein